MVHTADEIQRQLGPDCQVIAEYFTGDPDNDHTHIEYQPKPGRKPQAWSQRLWNYCPDLKAQRTCKK